MKRPGRHRSRRVPQGRPPSTSRNWIPAGVALLIVAAVLLVYVPAYQAGWSWDDDMSVWANELVVNQDGLAKILAEHGGP